MYLTDTSIIQILETKASDRRSSGLISYPGDRQVDSDVESAKDDNEGTRHEQAASQGNLQQDKLNKEIPVVSSAKPRSKQLRQQKCPQQQQERVDDDKSLSKEELKERLMMLKEQVRLLHDK